MEWFKIRSNVLALMEFLMDAELLVDKKDIIDFNKHPERFSEVWHIYQDEVIG